MKISRDSELVKNVKKTAPKLKVRVIKLDKHTAECRHESSNMKIEVHLRRDITDIVFGQLIEVEYINRQNNSQEGGYIVCDALIERVEAKVLDAQHIIANGLLYTSIILENCESKARLHSLVPNTNRLFKNTSILVANDIIKIVLNNGELFSIEL